MCNYEPFMKVLRNCLKKYGDLEYKENQFTYLGMNISQLDNYSVHVDMIAYTEKILKKYSTTKSCNCPSTLSLFDKTSQNSVLDDEKLIRKFKSELMELSYLTKVRCDIAKEINYLATCFNCFSISALSL